MDSLLALLSYAIFWLALVSLVGGGSAYLVDRVFFQARMAEMWSGYHRPWWDKQGNVHPLHHDCLDCELEVEKAGGELEGHSTLE